MLTRSTTFITARIAVDNSIRALMAGKRHKLAEIQNVQRALVASGKKPTKKKPFILERFDIRLRKLRGLADRLFIAQLKDPRRKRTQVCRELRDLVNAPLKGLI